MTVSETVPSWEQCALKLTEGVGAGLRLRFPACPPLSLKPALSAVDAFWPRACTPVVSHATNATFRSFCLPLHTRTQTTCLVEVAAHHRRSPRHLPHLGLTTNPRLIICHHHTAADGHLKPHHSCQGLGLRQAVMNRLLGTTHPPTCAQCFLAQTLAYGLSKVLVMISNRRIHIPRW